MDNELNSNEKPKVNLRKDPFEIVEALGLDSVVSGKMASDNSLAKIFEIASQYGCPARFLRLGGPRQFRADIISFFDETRKLLSPGYQMLLDDKIPEIEFILTNPYSEAFLNRMDAEKKKNWEIWRVKEQILEFTRKLLEISLHKTDPSTGISTIKIAFHNVNLVWNLGIAENQYVVARAYFASATGHDENIAELHLNPGSSTRLAEALISYYNSVKTDSRTDFVRSKYDLESIGKWPSLFKGNVILYPKDQAYPWVEKTCYSKFNEKAEVAWLSLHKNPECRYFNPVSMQRRNPIDSTQPWIGQVSRILYIKGITVAKFLQHIQILGNQYPKLVPRLSLISGSILFQGFQALAEFRKTGLQVKQLKNELQPYPWSQQLESAIIEAGKFVIDRQDELTYCRTEAYELGKSLEVFAALPFRDAHLKNRIIAIDESLFTENYEALLNSPHVKWLFDDNPVEMFEKLKSNTHDIDFETCFWKVSEWDDPLHILWSSNIGVANVIELSNKFILSDTWWTPPMSSRDKEKMWLTLLCRSLREYCRRLWYDHIMPETYQLRYSIEKRDHFLDLALLAAENLVGYNTIKIFLDRCKSAGDKIWNRARIVETKESVIPMFPEFIKNSTTRSQENPETTKKALEKARHAIEILEEQAAGFGTLHMPVHLKIELEDKRKEVTDLEIKLKDYPKGNKLN